MNPPVKLYQHLLYLRSTGCLQRLELIHAPILGREGSFYKALVAFKSYLISLLLVLEGDIKIKKLVKL